MKAKTLNCICFYVANFMVVAVLYELNFTFKDPSFWMITCGAAFLLSFVEAVCNVLSEPSPTPENKEIE